MTASVNSILWESCASTALPRWRLLSLQAETPWSCDEAAEEGADLEGPASTSCPCHGFSHLEMWMSDKGRTLQKGVMEEPSSNSKAAGPLVRHFPTYLTSKHL